MQEDRAVHLGRDMAFHIVPFDVLVNYAYSVTAELLTSNLNIVRVPSKDFTQVDIIGRVHQSVLDMPEHGEMKKRICLMHYVRDKAVTVALSVMAYTRVIW